MLEELSAKLNYHFDNIKLLESAVSHRSFQGKINNERLEFLGDAVLSFAVSSALFHIYPDINEGELSHLRASLVRGDTLAELAQQFELGKYLRLGAGELKSGGAMRTSILADAMEAVIGAIYLDGGILACEQCILSWYAGRLEKVTEFDQLKDPKTLLQEYLQAQKLPLPDYKIISIEGAAHQQVFYIECAIIGIPHHAEGQGSNRRKAEQQAAQKMLELIGNE